MLTGKMSKKDRLREQADALRLYQLVLDEPGFGKGPQGEHVRENLARAIKEAKG